MKPLASISLDLDNEWSYLKTHGNAGWKEYPSFFDEFIPIIIDILDVLNLKITLFIVGQDAALHKNREILSLLTKKGHEVGNHSFHHEPWFHIYSKSRIRDEIKRAEDEIYQATGEKPVGFRGPGFCWNHHLMDVLGEDGYLYDASTLPTYLGPLARKYYFWKSNLREEEKRKRATLYGNVKDGFRSNKPFCWKMASGKMMLEIPVTTIPLFKTPFHLSYLLYLSRFSERLMLFYIKSAIILCRITNTEPSFLLHPLDFLGKNEVPSLCFFPGMDISKSKKIRLFKKIITIFSKHYNIVNLRTHAHSILKRKKLN